MKKIIDFEIIELNEDFNEWYFRNYDERILKDGFIMEFEIDSDWACALVSKEDTKLQYEEFSPTLFLNLNDVNKKIRILKKDTEILKEILDEINWKYQI